MNIPLNSLQQKRLFFAHQSVGTGIINGLEEYVSVAQLDKFNITDQLAQDEPIFFHRLVGKNTDPLSKLDDFSILMHHENSQFDIAIFKFCYIDVTHQTNINTLFTQYIDCFEQLESEFSDTIFVHCTVPIKIEPQGIINRIRKLMGNISHISYSNKKRFEFNELLRDKYAPNNRLFDIAKLESTTKSLKRKLSSLNGLRYEHMATEYTNDGGHLNDYASHYVAKSLYTFLEKL